MTNLADKSVLQRRLVGLLVVMLAVFLFSWLLRLPHPLVTGDNALQTVVVPLSGNDGVLAQPVPELPITVEAVTALARPAERVSSAEPIPPVSPPVQASPVVKSATEKLAVSKPTLPKVTVPEKKPVSPAVAAAKAATTSIRWVVLVGSFVDVTKAQDVSRRIKAAGFPVLLTKSPANIGATKTRVRAGPFKTKDAAQSARAALIVEGLTGALVAKESQAYQ